MAPTWPNLVQLGPNLAQLGPNLDAQTPQLGAKTPALEPKTPPRHPQDAQNPSFWVHFGRFLEDSLEEFAVQPASVNIRTQLQKSQNINAALVALSGSSFAPQVLGRKMEASWHQNRSQNRSWR